MDNFRRYQRIAPFYDLLDLPFEFGRYRRIRADLFRDLSGKVLDAGVGTGRNIAFYPPDAQVVGIDLSPAMLKRAGPRARTSPASVELRLMDVTRIGFPDRHFDAAIATFLFCVLSEKLQAPALRELARVVRKGGTIRLLEYMCARKAPSGAPFRGFGSRGSAGLTGRALTTTSNGISRQRVSNPSTCVSWSGI